MVDIIKDPTACPNCSRMASGIPAIISVFGLRNMHDKTRRVQSWCRECRTKYRGMRRLGV